MLASVQSVVPIIASAAYTSFYNMTSDLPYPWTGSFYFLAAGFKLVGATICLIMYLSLGCKQIQDTDDPKQEDKSHDNEIFESDTRL